MKSRNVVITVIFLLFGSVTVELKAQEAIQALLKKCENMESMTVSVIREKDRETGKITRDIVNVSFKSDTHPTLEKEFLAAFQKDEDKADRVTKNISNGKAINMSFRFGDITYNYSYNSRTDMVSVNTTNPPRSVTIRTTVPTSRLFGDSLNSTRIDSIGGFNIQMIRDYLRRSSALDSLAFFSNSFSLNINNPITHRDSVVKRNIEERLLEAITLKEEVVVKALGIRRENEEVIVGAEAIRRNNAD